MISPPEGERIPGGTLPTVRTPIRASDGAMPTQPLDTLDSGHEYWEQPMDSAGAPEILLVEDNPGDIRLTREAFIDSGMPHRINVVTDGEAALDYLRRRGRHSDAERPGVILLDLHLPLKSGTEVLQEIKGDADLRRIPVIVLTGSTPGSDPDGLLELGAERYYPKPAQLDEFVTLVAVVGELLGRA